jgi:hypothetical protein
MITSIRRSVREPITTMPPESAQNERNQSRHNYTTTTRCTTSQTILSEHNRKNNIPNGNLMSRPKAPSTLRVYFQNINGVAKNNWSDWKEASRNISLANVDIFGCAETNLAWTEAKRKYAQHLLQNQLQQANMTVASSSEIGATDYQPGGTTTCITGKYTGRIIEQIHDNSGLGRWSGHILLGRANKHIVIITAYRPTKSDGYNTAYQQQWRLMRQRGHINPEPREQMLLDLQKNIKHGLNSDVK